jgi:hypothetical protein
MPDEEMIEKCVTQLRYEINSGGNYKHMVLVIIKAMREPTEKMIGAGCSNNPTQWNENTDDDFAADAANDVWIAMIDSILND